MKNISFELLGISSMSHAGNSIKTNQMLQKKSVFTIAYDEMATAKLSPTSTAGDDPINEAE